MEQLDSKISEWRRAVMRGGTVDAPDADELEEHLRDEVAALEASGLSTDEAFLIAVGRIGRVDQLTAEFAREHGDRLWKQLTLTPDPGRERGSTLGIMLGFAVLAAVLVHGVRLLLGVHSESVDQDGVERLARSASLLVLPVLAGYFAFERRMPRGAAIALGGVVAALAVVVNVFPLGGEFTTPLIALHLPIVLWFVVGVAYVGGDVTSHPKRMDFIRFTGEFAIYYALIALGGGVLLGLTSLVLTPIAPGLLLGLVEWVLPAGIAGAVVVAAWLVEAKKSIIENIAPVLTAIFTPLFALMLVIAAAGYAVAGVGRDFDRDLLIVFDVLLLVVLGLVVYGISARSARGPGVADVLRLVAVVAALALDLLVLVSMSARIGEFGLTPNRVAALGLNLVLLVNLAVTAWHIAAVVTRRAPAVRLERWQTGYLPVFALWVLFVALAVPVLFGFV